MLILIFSVIFFTILFLFYSKKRDLLKIKKISLMSSGLVLTLSTIQLVNSDINWFDKNTAGNNPALEDLTILDILGFSGLSPSFVFFTAYITYSCVFFVWDDRYNFKYIISLFLIELFLFITFTMSDLIYFYIFCRFQYLCF